MESENTLTVTVTGRETFIEGAGLSCAFDAVGHAASKYESATLLEKRTLKLELLELALSDLDEAKEAVNLEMERTRAMIRGD